MDISGGVANIHMRNDAKNQVTTARTMHIRTQNCFAESFTKASAKADNLITAVKTGRLLDVDMHLHFKTLTEHKPFLSTWCRT